ncbi:MAG: peptidoglycan DD-metalloendopeptidase family protein [Patescibacteria group bacterium]
MKVKHFFYLVIFASIGWFVNPVFFISTAKAADSADEIKVLNQEIAKRKDKIKELENTISKYRKNIVEKETQGQLLKNELGIIGNRISQIGVDIELTQEKIKENQLEIDALNISIRDKQKVIDRQKKLIAKIIQSVYSGAQKNYLEIKLTNNNFSDFYNDLKSLENINSDLGRSVRTLRLASEDLALRQKQVHSKQVVFQNLKNELEGKKESLTGQETMKASLLSQTKSSEARYKTLLSSLKNQYQVIETEQRTFEQQLQKKLEQQDKIAASGSVMMNWPVLSRVITTVFHDSDYPFRRVFEHSGLDIRASYGTPIKASAPGYVARARRCSASSCYSYILLVHTGNFSSVYGHLSSVSVSEDQFVNRGDIIGYSGGTPGTVGAGPFVTGPHLHFEVRQNGIPIDPMPYMVR